MTQAEEFLAEPVLQRPEPPRDRWGRPQLPDPVTGKVRAWTRATTHAKTVADQHGLTKWQLRMVAQGLVARPDYYAGVAAANGDKRKLDRLCDEAKEAAAASSRANLGTALHAFTEAHDSGQVVVTVPMQWLPDYEAYVNAMREAKIVVHPEWIERLTVVPEMEVAGTFDRIVTMPDGRLLIADLKTGADLSYSWNEIGIQLALYSRGVGLWNGGAVAAPADRRRNFAAAYDPMPPVDQHEALVMHLPVGLAKCTLHLVDLDVGWKMAQVCYGVRAWRKRRDLHRPLTFAPPAVTQGRTRTEWIRSRLSVIKAHGQARQMTLDVWPDAVPAKPPWTDNQIDMLHRILSHVETTCELGFPEPDPALAPAGVDRFLEATR